MSAIRDLMSLPQFEAELRRVGRFGSALAGAEALAAAVKLITDNPARHGSRLLARLMCALVDHVGEFRLAEISAFDSPTLRLAIALMDAAHAGTNSERQWRDAVAAADQANG